MLLNSPPKLRWYAAEVAYKKEDAVAELLRQKDFQSYLPKYDARRVWSDRIKKISLPLFSGYLFCRFDVDSRWLPVVTTPGVRKIVSMGRVPVAIPDSEIEAIRAVILSGVPIEPTDMLQEGSRVIVKQGSLTGVEGSFLRYQGRDRLVLSVSLIQRSVLVEIDRAMVEPIKSSPYNRPNARPNPLHRTLAATAST